MRFGVPECIFLAFFCIYQLAKPQISPTFRSPKGIFQQPNNDGVVHGKEGSKRQDG